MSSGGDAKARRRWPFSSACRAVGPAPEWVVRALETAFVCLAAVFVVGCPRVEDARNPGDLVAIAGGDFLAGCNEAIDSACFAIEKPGARRRVDDFSIDRTEVTVAAYRACVDAGKCTAPGGDRHCNGSFPNRGGHPINCVDWHQANTFCAWRGARLPSEWEWERAARGVDGDLHPWGNAPADCTRAVIDAGTGNGCGWGDTTFEVGSRPAGASREGVLDLIGNVWEWTASARENGPGRVVRGGGYYATADQARASFHLLFSPQGRAPFVGFRCAR